MPRVERNAEVTIVALVYRSLRWLEWAMTGADNAECVTRYRWLIVANDAEDEVVAELTDSGLDWIDHRNPNPGEYYINRVYRAWNRGVREAPTERVVMMNSDMYPADDWLDELVRMKDRDAMCVPTSLLVESGRMPSAMPEHVRDFGMSPDAFNAPKFLAHAGSIARPGQVEAGRLFMPVLVNRQEFIDIGGYPNGNPIGTTGDKDLFRRYRKEGFKHVTALGSIVYHCQEGEMRG